jgi:NTP pyrophosphatase (non-canonical NTP hydrolase)
MNDLQKMTARILAFRDARDWAQFHTPKDMALSLVLEAAELAEHFQWKSDAETRHHVAAKSGAIADELSDVLYWVLLMAHDFGVDLPAAFEQKMQKNEAKYPVEAARGKHTKYDDLPK